eukprot:SAG31_NODE_5822_length_2309_cov_1.138009_4_plen_113_part_01
MREQAVWDHLLAQPAVAEVAGEPDTLAEVWQRLMNCQRVKEQNVARLVLRGLPNASSLLQLLARHADAARATDEAQQILAPVPPHAESAKQTRYGEYRSRLPNDNEKSYLEPS